MGSSRDQTPGTSRAGPLGKILIVDDEVFIQNAFKLYFETIGYQAWVADGGAAAMEIFNREDIDLDVVILDLVMPGANGLELLEIFQEQKPDVRVIIATGCGSISSAIDAMRLGAFDYITKPIIDFDRELLRVVEDAILQRRQESRGTGRGCNNPWSTSGCKEARQAQTFLGHISRLSSLAAQWHASDPEKAAERPVETLAAVEEALRTDLQIRAGLLYTRDEGGEPVPAHSWGEVERLDFAPHWFSDRQLFDAVRNGRFKVFTIDSLNTDALGFEPTGSPIHPVALHIPVVLEGVHRGFFLLFFDREYSLARDPGALNLGQAYLAIAPLLGSFFLGVLKHVRAPLSLEQA